MDFVVKFNSETIRINPAALSFDERHLSQNVAGTDRIIENQGGIAAKDKLERFT